MPGTVFVSMVQHFPVSGDHFVSMHWISQPVDDILVKSRYRRHQLIKSEDER
jgi:hypothetical protein